MKNSIFLIMLFFVPQILLCMEEMKDIKNWQDAAPFIGQIVMYSSNSDYFNKKECYQIEPEKTNLNVGFVKEEMRVYSNNPHEFCYEIARLLRNNTCPSACSLINDRLEKAQVKMRKTTFQERAKVLEALNAKVAEFEYMFDFLEDKIREKLSQND